MSRHRKPAPPQPVTPLLCAGAALACLWAPLASAPATADATTATTLGAPVTEKTSELRRATRSAQRPAPYLVAVRAALSKLGRPYVWGAKGPNEFDCSGLVQWAYRQAGVALGPDTYTQIGEGVPVTAPRPGDLIFPSRAMGSRGPGHVVLAISATQAIEAPGRGMSVRLISLPAGAIRRVA